MKHPETFDENGLLNVVVETPKGSRNKLAWDEKYEMYKMKGVLPPAWRFPSISGFAGTKGQDWRPRGHSASSWTSPRIRERRLPPD